MKQECPLAFVVMAWLLYIGVIPALVLLRQRALLPVWVVVAPVAIWAYVKSFPAISPYVGYGRVDDKPGTAAAAPLDVTLYTALGCPFCRIVKRRLHDLQPNMGFGLHEVDVTARPTSSLERVCGQCLWSRLVGCAWSGMRPASSWSI